MQETPEDPATLGTIPHQGSSQGSPEPRALSRVLGRMPENAPPIAAPLRLAILAESHPDERRVALPPALAGNLVKRGFQVTVAAGAGEEAGHDDEAWRAAGVVVEADNTAAARGAELVLRIRPPNPEKGEVELLPEGAVLVSHLSPGEAPGLAEALEARGITALALERVPRTTRAQRMDVLSSQATVAGYRAVLRAAGHLPRFLPMLTTAAGTIRPAQLLVLGAGVAGLQAIATARRLGAAVTGYDIRPAAREQILSLGARVLEESVEAEGQGGYARALDEDEQARQLAFLAGHLPSFDIVITTAQIPGRPAPLLLTEAMARSLRPGGVVLDMAGETGGNCALSRPGEVLRVGTITVDAPLALPSEVPEHASEMFGRNVLALVEHLVSVRAAGEGPLRLPADDEILGPMAVVRGSALDQPPEEVEAAGGGPSLTPPNDTPSGPESPHG